MKAAMATSDAESLREYLAARDAACPKCQYNLRGLTGSVCPECRREVRLSDIDEPEVHLTAASWAGLFPLVLMALFAIPGIIGSGVGLIAALVGGQASLLPICLPLGAICCGMFWYECRWIERAEHFITLPRRTQWERAAVCWGILVLLLAVARIVNEHGR